MFLTSAYSEVMLKSADKWTSRTPTTQTSYLPNTIQNTKFLPLPDNAS